MIQFTPALLLNKYVLGAALIASVAGYIYYQDVKIDRLEQAVKIEQQNNSKLEEAIQEEKRAVALLINDVKKRDQINKDRQELIDELRGKNKELRDALYREQEGKKPLEELAIAKPGLVERAINSGTKDVFDCFEAISKGEEEKCLEESSQ